MVTEHYLSLYDGKVSIYQITTTSTRVLAMSEFIKFGHEWQGMQLREVLVNVADQKYATIIVSEQGFSEVYKFRVRITDQLHWLPGHFIVRRLFTPQLEKQICDIAIGVEDDLPF